MHTISRLFYLFSACVARTFRAFPEKEARIFKYNRKRALCNPFPLWLPSPVRLWFPDQFRLSTALAVASGTEPGPPKIVS